MNPLQLDHDLLPLLPPWYRQVLDYQQICQAEQQQLEALAAAMTAVAENMFFQTMDADAVAQWEQIFGITANPAAETLAFRQARVLNRISLRPPFTLEFLYRKLDELIGPGKWQVSVDYPNYTLYIESAAGSQPYAVEVSYTVNRVKPAHIVFYNRPFLTDGLLLSEEIGISSVVYQYKLGSWALGLGPFAQETDQGVIKLPTTPSIQPALLQDAASFISSDVASVLINGLVVITELQKSVSGNVMTLTYTVTPEQAGKVTAIALQDSSGTALSQAVVYVPVPQATIFKHIIQVSEGVNTNGQ